MIAFVLSGGGNRGALQAGALQALIERGIVPDLIVATSVGALNGVVLAGDPSVEGARRQAGHESGVGHELGMAFPAQLIAAKLRGMVADAGIGARRPVTGAKLGQMLKLARAVAAGGIAPLFQRQIDGGARRLKLGRGPGVKLVHQRIALRMFVLVIHAGMISARQIRRNRK